MHTVFVTTSYPRSAGDPAGHFVETEVRRAAAEGDQVTVIVPGRRAGSTNPPRVLALDDGDCFGWPGALGRVRERPMRLFGAARFVASARRQLASLGPSRIVAHWLVPSAFPIALASEAPLEAVAHGSDVRLLERMPARATIVRTLIERGTSFRFVSHELRTRLERATGVEIPRAVVAPCPLDVSGAPPRRLARQDLGIDASTRLAVVAGRLVPKKRIDRALSLARPRADAIVVIGDGPSRRELEAAFPWARFVGFLPRPRALVFISAADLVVSASLEEGAPTVVREARALGVPVLAVVSGDLRAWAHDDPGIELVGG